MSIGNAEWHKETRAKVLALEYRCKILEDCVSHLQRTVDEMKNAAITNSVVSHNLGIDRETQR